MGPGHVVRVASDGRRFRRARYLPAVNPADIRANLDAVRARVRAACVAAGATPVTGVELARRVNASGLRLRKRKGERGIHRWLGVPIGAGVTADIDLVASSLPTPDLGTGAAATIVRDRNKSFLLVHSIRRGSWDCPGGRREPGESVAECAARELAEETGLTLEPIALAPCGYERLTVSDPAHWAAPRPLVQVFLADLLAARPTVTPGDDVDAARWVSHTCAIWVHETTPGPLSAHGETCRLGGRGLPKVADVTRSCPRSAVGG